MQIGTISVVDPNEYPIKLYFSEERSRSIWILHYKGDNDLQGTWKSNDGSKFTTRGITIFRDERLNVRKRLRVTTHTLLTCNSAFPPGIPSVFLHSPRILSGAPSPPDPKADWHWRRPAVYKKCEWPRWGGRVLLNISGSVDSPNKTLALGVVINAVGLQSECPQVKQMWHGSLKMTADDLPETGEVTVPVSSKQNRDENKKGYCDDRSTYSDVTLIEFH